jgi:hypothetical protein
MAKDKTEAPAASGTALAAPSAPKYPIITTAAQDYSLIANGQEAIELFKENLAGQAIDPFSLTIIKVPSGGGTMWQVPTYSGMEMQKEITGIVIQIAQRRAYWKSPNPSGQPPDCASTNLEVGVGDNGTGQGSHECATCPMSQFGTSLKPDGSKGRGQACKQNKLLFMLTPGGPMPLILKVSPASLKPVLRFQTQMPVRFSAAIVAFGLTGTKNQDGTAYAEIVPRLVGVLPPEQAAYVQQFAKLVMGDLEKAADVAAATSDESGE